MPPFTRAWLSGLKAASPAKATARLLSACELLAVISLAADGEIEPVSENELDVVLINPSGVRRP